MPNEADKTAKESRLRRRLIFYGGVLALIWAFYLWQPYEVDFVARKAPDPNPSVDPDSALLFSPGARILLVTAHPDDSSFFVGGLLMQLARAGAEIHQVICTDGDKGYYPFEDWERNRRVRRQEALAEARRWRGKDILFLGRPDGRLSASDDVVALIRNQIEKVRPNYLLCFDPAFPTRMSHSDHRRAGEAAFKAASESGLPMWVLMFQTSAPNWINDITADWPLQEELLAIHKSQFYGERLAGIKNMVGGMAMQIGDRIGVAYAEGLRCVRLP